MHDIRLLRDQLEHLRDGMRRRGKLAELAPMLDRAESLERERRAAITELEAQQARRNKVTAEVGQRRKAGLDATELMAEGRAIGEQIATLEQRRAETEAAVSVMLYELPNITLPDVPEGDETANTVVRSWGTPRTPDASIVPHWEKGEAFGMIDMMHDIHTEEHGYEETWVPLVVNRASMTGTGNFPKFEEDAYAVTEDELFLIPTAEVPVTNLYRDEILEASELPKRFCAFSACFRREAGAAGKDTRGLLRVHEFDKVELVRYAHPDSSLDELELLTGQAETLLKRLELPYRVVLLAAGDTGFSSAKTYDLEVFAPGVGKWLEVSSCSLFTDFQARRANIRFRPAPGEKPKLVHTLNGSALAFSRIIASLLEHHQQPDGSVRIPEALQPYLGRAELR